MGTIVICQKVELKLYIVIISVQKEITAKEVIIALKILDNGNTIGYRWYNRKKVNTEILFA